MKSVIFIGLLVFTQAGIAAPKGYDLDSSKLSQYDHLFRKYTKQFFGDDIDWRWFKLQAIVESNMNNTARSNRGASGIMQILPSTYKEIQKKSSFFQGKTMDAIEWNIAAGIFYNRYLFEKWKKIGSLSKEKQLALMFASYNAGYGRVIKAYSKAGKPGNNWRAVSLYVPKQTSRYVKKITRLMKKSGWQTQKAASEAPGHFVLATSFGDDMIEAIKSF